MIEHPEVQEKIRKEINEVLGDKEVTLDDKGKFVYLDAVINEVHRLHGVLPLGVPRRAKTDIHCQFKGKGTSEISL